VNVLARAHTRTRALAHALALALALALTLASAQAAPLDPVPAGLPPAERFELDNGLTVLLVPNQGNPYLNIQLAFRAGGGADPAGKEGLASLLGRMLSAGTSGAGGLDEPTLAAELARLGGWIGTDAGMESFGLGGQIPTFSDVEVRRFLDIFVAMALEPTLPADLLEREKTLRLGTLQRVADNPESLAEIAVKLAAFGNNAFGFTGYGTPPSIVRITRDDLVEMHAALFNPAHGVLIVGGAFEATAMRTWIERRFGRSAAWAPVQHTVQGTLPGRLAKLCAVSRTSRDVCFDNRLASAPPASTGTAAEVRTIHIVVDDPGLTQIPWRLVATNPVAMLDPRWPAFRLGTFILGGDFTSRLNETLRTKEGLTYGAYFEAAFGGYFSGAMNVSTDATPDALIKSITLAKAELAKIAKEPLPALELSQSRAMMVNSFAFKFETLSDTIDQYLTLEVAHIPLSWLADWRTALGRPTAAEIQSSMTAIDPARMTLIVAGPVSLGPTLAKLGHGRLTTITAPNLVGSGLPD